MSVGVINELTQFYDKAVNDERIGYTHICLYMALFQFWNLNGFKNPVYISRSNLMKAAKISGRATYHKAIKQLEEYGYIIYIPSWNPDIKSRVYLIT